MLKPVLVAVQFLTRLPVPPAWLPPTYSDKLLGQSVLAYPVAGLIIGLLLWGTSALMSGLPSLVVAAVLLVLWVLLTGALHLDGLADCADAWIGGQGDRERMLAIMKDSFIGPVGVAVLVAVLLLKFAALAAIVHLPLGLLLTPILARACIILLFLTTPYIRANGLGQRQAQHLPRRSAYLVLLLIVVATLLLFTAGTSSRSYTDAIMVLVAVVTMFVLLRGLFVKHLGGMTGDTAGAMVEICEALLLLVFAVVLL